jgi:gentisate 1,2-dioxygenase
MSDLRVSFEDTHACFTDVTGVPPTENAPWAPVIFTKEAIDAEIERLANLPRPADGLRASLMVHPRALQHAPGLAPGIQVMLSVLKPGEATEPFRHNATEVNFCICGGGQSVIGSRRTQFVQYDAWNTPSYAPYWRVNDGKDLQACLTYSNVPLLRYMQVYIVDGRPTPTALSVGEPAAAFDPRRVSPFGTFATGEGGAMLMPYEKLINPPVVESQPLHWSWKTVKSELQKLESLGESYIGRRLYLLYNPVTGRTNGTTPNFFATITVRPPGIIDRPHRHVSAAINYYFQGRGRSSVAGNIYRWKAGDLMLSAPGWTVHNHASDDELVYELTVQDQPLNIAMDSLLWQEDMKSDPALLGSQLGFDTNRSAAG